eukprot:TRINITY_DN4436_c0_g1_i1.p1 TRINITY_DN4436_c0_g1~~TRINITY_DN4436_c0_g1_i1.p1  ORF type:complete len:196 (+),score=46.26 TRINITY_DN4436_c0_g1_i1:5-592(+)
MMNVGDSKGTGEGSDGAVGRSEGSVYCPTIPKDAQLDKLCHQYSTYLEFPELTQKQVSQVEESLLKMLTRLDELAGILQTCALDNEKLQNSVPELYERATQLQRIYFLIDRISEMVERYKQTAKQLEDHIEAEEEANSAISIKKVFSVFATLLDSEPTPLEEKKDWEPVSVPDSKAYFSDVKQQLPHIHLQYPSK